MVVKIFDDAFVVVTRWSDEGVGFGLFADVKFVGGGKCYNGDLDFFYKQIRDFGAGKKFRKRRF